MKKKLALTLLLLYPLTVVHSQTIRYVKTTADGGSAAADGLAWATASDDLQAMISASADGDQIWVGAGTYVPVRLADNPGLIEPGNHHNAFTFTTDLTILGGFPAAGGPLEIRDPDTHFTILSGDLGAGNRAYHVVITAGISPDFVLDGFVIENGNADGGAGNEITVNELEIIPYYGGGWYNHSASPTVRQVLIRGNGAENGAGWYNHSGNPQFSNSLLTENLAVFNGGGWHNASGSPSLTTSEISNNYTGVGHGAGWYNQSGDPVIRNTQILSNTAGLTIGFGTYAGGGWYNASGNPNVVNSYISGNRAYNGAGWYNQGGSPVVTNTVISGNLASANSPFSSAGGGWFNATGNPILTNVTISGNRAVDEGGAWFQSDGSPSLTNSVIYGNGDGISGTLGNITYSLAEGLTGGTGNLDGTAIDPSFVSAVPATDAPTTAGDYALNAGSPVVNLGNPATPAVVFPQNESSLPIDISGAARFYGPSIDMGAYELHDESALPVTLVYFEVANYEQNAMLTWQTSAEKNAAYFQIERSFDAKNWKVTGRVNAEARDGQHYEYVFIDTCGSLPSAHVRYYRLKMIDLDATFTFSNIVVFKPYPSEAPTLMYPNPATEYLTIESPEATTMTIYTHAGRKIREVVLNTGKNNLDISDLQTGLYLGTTGGKTLKWLKK